MATRGAAREGGLSRRTFLLGAGAGAVALPLVGGVLGATPARAAGPIPIRLVNNSGAYGDDRVFVHVLAERLAGGGQGWVDPSGAWRPASLSDNGPDGTTGYGVPLSEWRTVNLPDGHSGRIYISLGQKLPFRVVGTPNGAGIAHPAGWVSGDPSFGILYDSFEYTYLNGGMFCNSTQVDMFSLPIAIRLLGASEQRAGAIVPGGRARFFERMRQTEGFAGLVVDDRRVIAPSHGIGAGRFDAGYLDGYIAESWDRYTGQELRIDAGPRSYRLRTEGGTLVARENGAQVAAFARPSTSDVLFCNGALTAPNDGVSGPIAAILGAALNRTVLRDRPVQPTTDPALFYREPRTNAYAAATHEVHADGRAYGFAFDDVGAFASYIEDRAATSVELTVEPL